MKRWWWVPIAAMPCIQIGGLIAFSWLSGRISMLESFQTSEESCSCICVPDGE